MHSTEYNFLKYFIQQSAEKVFLMIIRRRGEETGNTLVLTCMLHSYEILHVHSHSAQLLSPLTFEVCLHLIYFYSYPQFGT